MHIAKRVAIGLFSCAAALPTYATDEIPATDNVLRALVDELQRSLTLQLEDLEKPYFIQYSVDEVRAVRIAGSYGALVGSSDETSRRFQCQVRVGSPELDNTNFRGGGVGGRGARGGRGGGAFGGAAALPIDDDYTAIRQAIWRVTDSAYRDAVETLTQKRAYMEDKKTDERAADFSAADPVVALETRREFTVDRARWEDYVRKISARFREYPHILDANVSLSLGSENKYLINSEGTQLRRGEGAVMLRTTAFLQAEDGQRLGDGCTYLGESPEDLPSIEVVLADLDQLAAKLGRLAKAPVLEDYSGPVLFDGVAAGQFLESLLASGLAGQPDAVGVQRRRQATTENLESQLGKRILPAGFQVYDNPTEPRHGSQWLAGHFRFDEEGVAAQRVSLVEDGKLVNLLMSRVPTRERSGSNGHARAGARAGIGNLFVTDSGGVARAELLESLLELAEAEGLEYAIRVTALAPAFGGGQDLRALLARAQGGAGGRLNDPLYVYKVFVDDGREELVRGCEFGEVTLRALKRIEAAGDTPTVHNDALRGTAIIAPPLLVSEMELAKIQAENDTKPILEAPHQRQR
ncbi:MAG: metallopeptidase TldD-related protein [Planctomycetota bacterium]